MRKVLLILAIAGIALVVFDSTAEATWRHRAAGGCCAPVTCCEPVCDPCCDPCATSCCGTSVGYASHHGGWGYRRAAYRPTRFQYATSYARSYGGCCN